jgi:hypothetical protein
LRPTSFFRLGHSPTCHYLRVDLFSSSLREQSKALKLWNRWIKQGKVEKRKKMSQVIDVCEDSDDNEERPNSASSFQSILLSGKRAWDKTVESSKGSPPRNWNGPEKKNATGSAEFCVDLKLADEVEESPQKKRRGAVSSIPSSKNDAEGKCAQILLGVEATEQDVGSEDTQVPYHSEYHEGIPAAASQPMNSDSKQTSRDDGSPIKHSKKLSASKPSSNTSGRQYRVSAWEDRFTELADSQNPRALQCSSEIQRKPKAGYVGHSPKEPL